MDWVQSQRQDGYIVTRGLIRIRALQLKKSEKYRPAGHLKHFWHQQAGALVSWTDIL